MTFLSGQNAWSARWKHRLFGGVAIVWLTMITPSLAQTGQSDAPARTATLEKLIEAGRLTQAREALAKLHAAQEQTPTTRYLEAKLLFRERRFVLEPLAAVAPEMRDPVSGRTVAELLSDAAAGSGAA